MAEGHIKIDTRLDNSKIKGDLSELENTVKNGAEKVTGEFAQKVEKLSATWSKLEAQQAKNNAKIQEFKTQLEGVGAQEQKIASLQNSINYESYNLRDARDAYSEGAITLEQFNAKQEEARKKAAELKTEIEQVKNTTSEIDVEKIKLDLGLSEAKAKDLNAAMSKVGLDAQNLKNGMEKTDTETKGVVKSVKQVNAELKKATPNVNNVTKGMSNGIKTLAKYALALFSIRTIYSGITKAVNAWMSATQEGQQAQADMQGIWQSLGQTIAPVIQWLIGLMRTLLGYANAVTKALFGFELFTKSAASNLNDAVGSAKALQKSLAGFDEMNILGSNGQQNAAGASSIAPTEISAPDISGFKKSIDTIKGWLNDIWNSETMQSFFDSFSRIGKAAFDSLVLVGSNVWENLVQSWNEALPYLQLGFTNMVLYWQTMFSDIADTTEKWLPSITQKLNDFVDNIFSTFRPLTTFIAQVWSDFTQIMIDLWNKYGVPILDEIGKFIDGMVELWNQLWTKIIDPIISPAIEMLKNLWDNHIKGTLSVLGSFLGELVLIALKIWNNVIQPIIMWISDKLSPIIKWLADTIFPMIGNSIGYAFDQVKNILNTAKGILEGFVTFITGVFSGDWKKAWEGVTKIFSSVWEGMKSIFKTPINWIIDQLNVFLRQLNKIKIPNWVPGLGGMGLSFKEIPKLALGGITTGATTAIIGESGREAVVPLQNNTGWAEDFLRVLESYGGSIGGSQGTQIIQLVLPNGKVLAELVNDENEKSSFSSNGGLNYGY